METNHPNGRTASAPGPGRPGGAAEAGGGVTLGRVEPLVQFVRGRLRDGRITGKYLGHPVEAWVVPANPPAEKRHYFVLEFGAGARGKGWQYRGGGAWERPHDPKHEPVLLADDTAVRERLEALGVRPILATIDLYRPELRYDGERGVFVYRQVIPGAPHFPPSDTFAQILSVLRQVADLNRRAQRR